MPGVALALALGSAGVHALWNIILSRARDSEAATAVAIVAGAVIFAPVAALTWDIESAALPYLAGSAALEVVYFTLLAAAYERGELTLIYPIARGSAPVLVAVFSVLVVGAALGALTVAGVAAIAAGILLVRGRGGSAEPRHVALALAIGTTIAAYTLLDKAGLRHAHPLPYLELVILPSAVVYPLIVARMKGRAALAAEAGPWALLAGIAMFGAFGLALAAIRLAPQEYVPAVQALRETSVVMAVAAGGLLLGEPVGRGRALGSAIVVAGVAALALA